MIHNLRWEFKKDSIAAFFQDKYNAYRVHKFDKIKDNTTIEDLEERLRELYN